MNKVLYLLLCGQRIVDWSYFDEYLVRVRVQNGFMQYNLYYGRWGYLSMEEMKEDFVDAEV